ncbi:hypothetical protein BDV96DRAFT_607870 [Lophiotrema nucula]|uniref:Heterokaryon incompatibility domain-containing protein n=1 Tax=Lophiotrema nucula TaxID=690887 RepID=A0A6A5YGL6_9PLEO|nr:hypothetical protein BDV96DRAFT_607870 [Lophiotrema nucula]
MEEKCVIWMGEIKQDVSLAEADAALQFLRYMGEIAQADDEDSVMLPSVIRDNIDATIEALKGLGNEGNQWWNRIWTVQEAVLPRKLTMQWGPLTLPWAVLEEAIPTWQYSTIFHGILSRKQIDVLGTVMVHTIWLRNTREDDDELYMLIHKWRIRQATDLRDKIYGILGICEAGRLPRTELCNYGISPAKVFCTLTLELILDERGLRALTPYPRPSASQTTPGMPSWALDLGSTGQSDVPDAWFQIHGYTCYRADDGLDQIDLDTIRSQFGHESLSLVGIYVDKVVQVEKGYKKAHGWEKKVFKDGTSTTLMARAHLSGDRRRLIYPGGRYDRAEAFAKLVLGEMIRDDNSFPKRAPMEADLEEVWRLMDLRGSRVEDDTRSTVYGMMANQNMFVTELTLMGLGHLDVQVGDEVWIFRGGKIPFMIRPRTAIRQSGYSFIGHCYVQGIMSLTLKRGINRLRSLAACPEKLRGEFRLLFFLPLPLPLLVQPRHLVISPLEDRTFRWIAIPQSKHPSRATRFRFLMKSVSTPISSFIPSSLSRNVIYSFEDRSGRTSTFSAVRSHVPQVSRNSSTGIVSLPLHH